jgi:hypothetical protein
MIVMVIPVFGVKIGTLPEEVLKPELIRVQGNELLVVEGPTIFIFSLDDLKLKRKFGKEGEGPGEFKKVPNFSNNIIVHPSSILVESLDKISYFSREGELIKEKRKYPGSLKVMPVGENFAVTGFLQGKEGKLIAVLSIFNSEMEKKQELYQQKFSQQGISEADLIPDSLNFWVYDNKIFVEESPNGFFIEVFDKEGKIKIT